MRGPLLLFIGEDLGFTRQTGGSKGRVVGNTVTEARRLLKDARVLDDAGICMLVLELVPEELSQIIAKLVTCVVIGIGAGRGLDGEVQVVNDLLGITERVFRHTWPFTRWRETARKALGAFVASVRERRFPQEANVTHLPDAVLVETRREFTE